MNRFYMITKLEWKLMLRDFMTVFFAILFPIMMLLLFGSMYGNEPSDIMGGYGSVDVLIPGFINMVVAVTGINSLPLTISLYRERKILKRFKVTPLEPREILLSQLIVNLIMTILALILLFIVGIVVFKLRFYGNYFEALVAFLLIVLSVFSYGVSDHSRF